jgi:cobyrinic acid a,c-diamide synthase
MAALGLPVLGALPRDAALTLPARHLGLVQARENAALDGFLDRAADLATEHVDCAALAALARRPRIAVPTPPSAPPLAPLGQRIAIARDDAFAFCYPALVASWRSSGAEISLFSPLADEAPDGSADAVYLPGGYPELHAERIAGNVTFLDGLRAAAARGAILFGECGGYMVLGCGLVDDAGARHAMAGLLALETSFEAPRLHLGYRDAVLAADGALGSAGARFRGHEFHYANVLSENRAAPLWRCHDARGHDLGPAGMAAGPVMGSFIHLIDRV